MEPATGAGMAIKNATVAPGFAPCRRKAKGAGTTPHEHKGSGAPMVDAPSTDFSLPALKSLARVLSGTTTASTPAMKKPKSRKTEACLNMFQVCHSTCKRNSVIG